MLIGSGAARADPSFSQVNSQNPRRPLVQKGAVVTYSFTVQLLEVHCNVTESIHSSDKFALGGSLFTKEGPVGVVLPLMRINDNETRDLREWTYRLESAEPVLGISLQAWDRDENDSWPATREKAEQAAGLISTAMAAVPGWGTTVAAIIGVASPVIFKTIDALVGWDEHDLIIDWQEQVEFGPFSLVHAVSEDREIQRRFADDNSNYIMRIKVTCSSSGASLFPANWSPPKADPAAAFRSINDAVFKENLGHVAAYPTFLEPGPHGSDVYVNGVCFTRDQVEWRDVPMSDLENPALDNFGERMRAANSYASRRGFLGGFPTYHHAEHPDGIVCGTVLIPRDTAEWRDVPLAELKGATLNDPVSRFVATHRYAIERGWLTGFPNMFHADKDGVLVCGSIFVKFGKGSLRDVFLGFGPR